MREFEDDRSPCPCPRPVIELLDLAVRYAEASLPESAHLGASYVKTFMEQPAEEWCAYVTTHSRPERLRGRGDA